MKKNPSDVFRNGKLYPHPLQIMYKASFSPLEIFKGTLPQYPYTTVHKL